LPPADEFLTFGRTDRADRLFATLTLSRIGREKDDSYGKLSRLRKLGIQLIPGHSGQEIVR
jgi:hypothetical protein